MSKPAPIEGLDSNTALEDAARASIAARLADVRRFEEKLTGAVEPDDVHDMRVASRRLRAALALFDRKRQLRDAYDAATALGDALGEVRELHVQLAAGLLGLGAPARVGQHLLLFEGRFLGHRADRL